MMTFQSMLAITLEYLGPFLIVGPILLLFWILALGVSYKLRPWGRLNAARLWRWPLLIGLVCGIAAMLIAPGYTGAGLGALDGALDWIVLIGVGLGAFVAMTLFLYAPFRLALGSGHETARAGGKGAVMGHPA